MTHLRLKTAFSSIIYSLIFAHFATEVTTCINVIISMRPIAYLALIYRLVFAFVYASFQQFPTVMSYEARSNCALVAAVGTLCIDCVSRLVDHVPCFEYHLNKSIIAISRADVNVPHWFRLRREIFDVVLSSAFITLQGMYSFFLFV